MFSLPLVARINMGQIVTYQPTGVGDQTALNALMAANAAKVSPAVVVVLGGVFAVDVDSVIPSGTSLNYNQNAILVGPAVPFAMADPVTQPLGAMTSVNVQGAKIFNCSVSIPVGTRIGLELNSASPTSNALVRLQFEVVAVSGVGPFTITVDDIIPVEFPAANVVEILSRRENIAIECNGCQVTTARHIDLLYADRVTISNFVGTGAAGLSLAVGSTRVECNSILDTMTLFLAACRDSSSNLCEVTDVAGPAFVLDDCVRCYHKRSKSLRCINGGIMGTNLVAAVGAKGGSWKSGHIRGFAANHANNGFDVENGCVDCEITKCEAKDNGNIGFHVIAGWTGVGPTGTIIENPTASGNPSHLTLGNGGSTEASGTIVRNVEFRGQDKTSTIRHSATISGGKHEGGLQTLTGTYTVKISDLSELVSSQWGMSISGPTVGTCQISDCPKIQAMGAGAAGIVMGANVKVLLEESGFFSNTGQSILFAGAGATLRMLGRIEMPQSIGGVPGNFLSRYQCTLVGGNAVVAWPDFKVLDRINVQLATSAGVTGAHYSVAPNPGVGFAFNAVNNAGALVATDVSTLYYEVG